MKHYEWQKMVKSGILHELQVTCNEEWNVYEQQEMVKSRVFHASRRSLWETQNRCAH